jgi:hypothetical protein
MQITVALTGKIIAGAPTVRVNISTSPDGITWTNYPNALSAYIINFRYITVEVIVSSSAGLDLYLLQGLEIKLSVQLVSDAGLAACLSTDTNGTIVNFNVKFIEVASITLTPNATTSITAVYEDLDALENGTYVISGTTCTFTYAAHGFLVGQNFYFNPSTGGAPAGVYPVATVPTTGTLTFTVPSGFTGDSGNATVFPESMAIYLFNSTTGARVSGNCSWSLKGY